MRRLLPAATLSLLSVAALQAESPKPTSERPTIQPDPRIASYRPTRSLSGELKSTANDEAFVEVIEAWAAAFMKEHPALRVSVKERKGLVPGEGLKGVSEPPALAPGSLHFGPDGWVF